MGVQGILEQPARCERIPKVAPGLCIGWRQADGNPKRGHGLLTSTGKLQRAAMELVDKLKSRMPGTEFCRQRNRPIVTPL